MKDRIMLVQTEELGDLGFDSATHLVRVNWVGMFSSLE